MNKGYDIVVIGSGFAGSLTAMIARRLGHSVALLEKGKHPRVVIGESSTPLSNLLLETLSDRYDLPKLKPLAKWGSWQVTYPNLACGLKRGFTFLHHKGGRADIDSGDANNHLLVAASPNAHIADTHWFRAEVDEFLVQQAREADVDYFDQLQIENLERDGEGWSLSVRRSNQNLSLRTKLIIDATGPRGFLYQSLGLEEAALPNYPHTSALYNHFSGVGEITACRDLASHAPYPLNAAALHHVFDGGWMWVLHFNNGWTSAGCALSGPLAKSFGLRDKASAWKRLLEAYPQIKQQFAHASPQMDFTHVERLSFRSGTIAGRNWAMLPSAAGFVDPILSTGFPLVLLGVSRLAHTLEEDWNSPRLEKGLSHYARATDDDLLATAGLVGALYANMGNFPVFRALTLLYFAAASYSETVLRLGKPQLANSFLLHNDPVFGPGCRFIVDRAQTALDSSESLELQEQVYSLISGFDVAGLCNRQSNYCFPVKAEDLLVGAHKVGASRKEIEALIERSGF